MAARIGAASLRSLSWYLIVWLLLLIDLYQSTQQYSRQELINVGVAHCRTIMSSFQQTYNIPDAIARTPGWLWTVIPEKRRRRRRERGSRSRAASELGYAKTRTDHQYPASSLSNAKSITHKIGELEHVLASNNTIRNSNAMIFMET